MKSLTVSGAKPMLSIVVPVYNTQKYLRECLNSLVNQTLKDIKIIIVNDCTPDNSEEIILEYAYKDPRIHYIKHKRNLGLGGARNTGIKAAKTPYITFVDSDDFVSVDCYQNMMDLIKKHNADCGVFSAENFDDETGEILDNPYFNMVDKLEYCTEKNIFSFTSTAWNKIFKTDDIIKNNIWFPNHLYHEDEEFWFKYAAKVQPLIVSDKTPYYHYRKRNNSITSNNLVSWRDLPHILSNIYHFLIKENLYTQYKHAFSTIFQDLYAHKDCFKQNDLKKFEHDFHFLLKELNLTQEKSTKEKLIAILKKIKIYPIIHAAYQTLKKFKDKA